MLRVALTGAAVAWGLLLVLAPGWAAPPARVAGDGRATVAALVRVIGAQVCHQRPDRSFALHGRSLPVCGRCTALYAAGALGLLAVGVGRRRRPQPAAQGAPTQLVGLAGRAAERVGLDPRAGGVLLAAAPTLATWAIEVAGLWDPGTPLRALAALPLGATAGWLMARALDD